MVERPYSDVNGSRDLNRYLLEVNGWTDIKSFKQASPERSFVILPHTIALDTGTFIVTNGENIIHSMA